MRRRPLRRLSLRGRSRLRSAIAKQKTAANGTRAVLYVRISTLEQLKGVSLEAQEERLRAYCQMSGLTVGPEDVIREEGVSASVPLCKRPGGSRLLDRIGSGVTHVVGLKLDRLFRDAYDALGQTKTWDRAGITLHLVDMGGASLNTTSAMGRMLLTCMAGFAELERNLVSDRTCLSLKYKRLHREVYNHAPYGFDAVDKMLIENPTELAVVELVRERREDGWSLQMIADALNEDRVPTKLNGRWHARTAKNILDGDLYDHASSAEVRRNGH